MCIDPPHVTSHVHAPDVVPRLHERIRRPNRIVQIPARDAPARKRNLALRTGLEEDQVSVHAAFHDVNRREIPIAVRLPDPPRVVAAGHDRVRLQHRRLRRAVRVEQLTPCRSTFSFVCLLGFIRPAPTLERLRRHPFPRESHASHRRHVIPPVRQLREREQRRRAAHVRDVPIAEHAREVRLHRRPRRNNRARPRGRGGERVAWVYVERGVGRQAHTRRAVDGLHPGLGRAVAEHGVDGGDGSLGAEAGAAACVRDVEFSPSRVADQGGGCRGCRHSCVVSRVHGL